MGNFDSFKKAVQEQFDKLAFGGLYVTGIDKYELWDTYLGAFPEGTNPIYKERTEHDCNCCKQFVRACGGVVGFVNGKLESIWDIELNDDTYQPVADALSAYVKSLPIVNEFKHYEKRVGTDKTFQLGDDGTITWGHFTHTLPNAVVMRKDAIPSYLSEARANFDVLKRTLVEVTIDAGETILELIAQKSLYRGDEYKDIVTTFVRHKKKFDKIESDLDKDIYCWQVSGELGGVSRIRNTAIGTLLVDLSEDRDLEAAVKSFEDKVAPANYKRPTALITKGMIEKAQKDVAELGFTSALQRRFAVTEDITINNVLFANREAKAKMDVFDELAAASPVKAKAYDKVDEISIEDFIANVVPKADKIEMMVENKHSGNLMSLIAPVDPDSKCMLKWDNNFSWTYNGEVADSMKERVKAAGGKVDGEFRASLSWASLNDLDLHMVEPNGNEIYYGNMHSRNRKGRLDLDNTRGGTKDNPALENIYFIKARDMAEGRYKVFVRNFSGSNTNESGFDFEVEFKGEVYQMHYPQAVTRGRDVVCMEFDYTHAGGLKVVNSLELSSTSKEVWGINTGTFVNVKMIMNSPNHWDGHSTGNKHHFFMLEDCVNPDDARGFYNEFLSEDLTKHRKVFEVLGSKLKAEHTPNQLSGVGFSTTQRNSALFKVTGKISRTLRVAF